MKLRKLISETAAAFCFGAGLFGCSHASGKELKVLSQKTVELGEAVRLDASDYLLEEPAGDVLEKIVITSPLKTESKYSYNDFSKTVTTAGKDFLEKGSYTVTLSYNGQEYPVTLTVKDTTMPVFVSPSAVLTIPVGENAFDFGRVYRTQDKDSVSLKIEGDYDLKEVGAYPVTLVAADASGNTNSLEITINVVGKNQQIKASDQFDDELVPSEADTHARSSETPGPSDDSSRPAADSSQASSQEPSTASSQTPQDSEQPEPEEPTPPSALVTDPAPVIEQPAADVQTPSACAISGLPAGSEAYYSFSDLYAAGTAWNQQSPDNYFYYLEGVDDCGNKIYALTRGTQTSQAPGSDPSDLITSEQEDPVSFPVQPDDPLNPIPSFEGTDPEDQSLSASLS